MGATYKITLHSELGRDDLHMALLELHERLKLYGVCVEMESEEDEDCPTFYLCYETSLRHRHQLQAVDLNDAEKKARETLRAIVLPTDRPGYSIKWAYLEHSGEKVWLIKKGRWEATTDA